MSRIVVTPAARYAGSHSICAACACMSHRPGAMVAPLTSSTRTPRGIGVDARGPAAAIRPSRTITTASSIGGRPVPSISARAGEARTSVSATAGMFQLHARQIGHAVRDRRRLQRGQRVLQILANAFERQDVNARHDRGKAVGSRRARPFPCPRRRRRPRSGEGSTSRRRRVTVSVPRMLDADVARRLARQHRQGLRAGRAAPSNESAARAPRAAHNFVQ